MEKYRSRNFALLLYPEDPTHKACLEKLEQGGYNYACILHNHDTWASNDPDFNPEKHTDGETKKEHWHLVIKFQNPKYDTGLATDLGIARNYIRDVKNFDKALLYLVHVGYPDKYQYDIDDVTGPLKITLQKLLLDEDEGSRVLRIVEMIDNSPAPTYREILVKACKAGLYGEFRRLGVGVGYLIREKIQAEESANIAALTRYHARDGFCDHLKTRFEFYES